MNKNKRLTMFAMGLVLLLISSGCSKETSQALDNQVIETTTQAVPASEDAFDEVDPAQALDFVNASGLMPDGVTLGPDAKAYKLDFTLDGVEDLCFVTPADGGLLGPVAFVTQDKDTGDLVYVPSRMYADTDFTVSMEDDFIIRKQADGTGPIKQVYIYSQSEGVIPLMNGSFMTGTQSSVENHHEQTQFIYEHDLTMADSYYDFTVVEDIYFVDERGDQHHFANKTRHYVLDEEEKSYQVEEAVEMDYPDVHSLRAQIGYYGDRDDLESFESILQAQGLVEALEYYTDHRYSFDLKSKAAYVEAAYQYINGPIFTDYFTDIYDVGYAEEEDAVQVSAPNPVRKELQDVYKFCKVYYAMEGHLEIMGYEYAVADIKISRLINTIIYDKHLYRSDFEEEVVDAHEDMRADMVFTSIEDVLNYPFAYPRVIVNDENDLEKMRHEDVWKTSVLLPVDVTYKEESPEDKEGEQQALEEYNLSDLQVGDKVGAFIIDEISKDPQDQKMFLAIGLNTFKGHIEKDIIMEDAYQFYSRDLAFGKPVRLGERLIETLEYAYINNQSIVSNALDEDLIQQLEIGESVEVKAKVSLIEYNDFSGFRIYVESIDVVR